MNYFIVFDFETDGTKPEICQPTQLASITIDPYNLEILENSKFCSYMKPPNIESEEYLTKDVMSTVRWHAGNMKCTTNEVLEIWKNAPPTELVWKNFAQHVNKYNPKKTQKGAPIFCGMNIKNFDLPIAKRLNEKYKVTKLYNHECIDLRDFFFVMIKLWDSEVDSISMDNMRRYLSISAEGAHDAMKDVVDSAKITQRYLQFCKRAFNANKFKGCMHE